MHPFTPKSMNLKTVNFRVIHDKGEVDATTKFTPISCISVLSRWRKDISKEQYARDQVYSVKNSAASGIQPQHR